MKTKNLLLAILITLSLNTFGQVGFVIDKDLTDMSEFEFVLKNQPALDFNAVDIVYFRYCSRKSIGLSFGSKYGEVESMLLKFRVLSISFKEHVGTYGVYSKVFGYCDIVIDNLNSLTITIYGEDKNNPDFSYIYAE